MILKRDYAIYEPSHPIFGLRHSGIAHAAPPMVTRIRQTEEDDPERVKEINKILERRKARG